MKRIPWFVIAVTVSVLMIISTFFSYFRNNSKKMGEISDQYMDEIAAGYSQLINAELNDSASYLENVSVMLQEEKNLSLEQMKDKIDEMVINSPFNYIRIIRDNGTSLYEDSAINIGDRDYYKKLTDGRSGISQPVMSRYIDERVILVYTPLVVKDLGVIGVTGIFELDDLATKFSTDKFSENASYHIVDREGEMITGEGASIKNILSKEDDFHNRKPGKISYQDGGSLINGYYSPLYVNDWFVYVKLSDKISAAMVTPFRNNALLFIVRGSLALGLLALAFVPLRDCTPG